MILYNESFKNCFCNIKIINIIIYHNSLLYNIIVIYALRKNIMKEIGRLWNFATREFAEVNTRVESHVETIKPSEEYKDFADRHK